MLEPSVFQKIAGYVGTYAPGIAAILAATGVGAPVAGAVAAIGALAKSFGLPEDSKPETVLATIQSMPDSELKLKYTQAENNFQLAYRDQEIQKLKIDAENFKTQVDDVQNARGADVAKVEKTGKRDNEDKVFDWFVCIGFYVSLAAIICFKPAESTMLGAMLGTAGAGYLQVLSYRKGTTRGSETKTDMIYNSTPNVPKKEV
jgi:hypothetical protein